MLAILFSFLKLEIGSGANPHPPGIGGRATLRVAFASSISA
jgi:hypothetical protein